MRIDVLRLIPAAAVTALVMVGACGDDPTAPGIEPQITNLSDAFSYQVSSIQNFTGTYSYTWQNTGTVAKITHASDAGATRLSDAHRPGRCRHPGLLRRSWRAVVSP